MAEKHTTAFSGQRITFTTPQTYDTVSSRLYASIARDGIVPAEELASLSSGDITSFTSFFATRVGPHGFLEFREFDHGAWIKLFGVGDGLRLKRIILGNPLVATTMLEHDLDAGLFVPVEILLKELPEGKGTEVFYVLPSSLIAGANRGEKLVKAAEVLDSKLEALVRDITAVE